MSLVSDAGSGYVTPRLRRAELIVVEQAGIVVGHGAGVGWPADDDAAWHGGDTMRYGGSGRVCPTRSRL